MLEIDPVHIENLYKKHNFKPRRTDVCDEFGECQCCVLGILYLDEHNNLPTYLESDVIYIWAMEKFGRDFTEGLWRGFDSQPDDCLTHGPLEAKQGFEQGKKVKEHLKTVFGEI